MSTTLTTQKRILCVLTRDPGGPLHGRKCVLRTMLSSLVSFGCEVHVVVIGGVPSGWAPENHSGRYFATYLAAPSLLAVGRNAAAVAISDTSSFNEALYDHPTVRSNLHALAAEIDPDIAIADTIRTAELVRSLEVPWAVDLDDLYSKRYENLALDDHSGSVIGYVGDRLPGFVRHAGDAIARRLLGREAQLVRQRECEIAQQADAVVLVSESEARELTQRCGVKTTAIPMSVPPSVLRPAEIVAGESLEGVFVGKLDYAPNLAALEWYAECVVPLLPTAGLEDFRLNVIGSVDPALSARLSGPNLRFVGYVEDLPAALAGHHVFLAPMQSGTGVSTKLLDAMSVGLPIVASDAAVAGIPLEDGRTFFRADDPAAVVSALRQCKEQPQLAKDCGEAGRQLLATAFDPSMINDRWRSIVEGLFSTAEAARPAHAFEPAPTKTAA